MREKLRRIKLERRTFEAKHDREELDLLTMLTASMKLINQQKGELAESATELFFHLYLDPEHWLPFTYPKELTQMINQLKDGFLYQGASEGLYIRDRNEMLRDEPKYTEKWLHLSNFKTLMNELACLSKDDESASAIIKEIQWRFDGLDDDYGMPRFLNLLGELKGTQFDYAVRKDGKSIIFDSKYWLDSNKNLRLKKKKLAIYKDIRKLGIPFYLMIYSIDREYLIQFNIDLISLDGYGGFIDKDLIIAQPKRKIPKRLIEFMKRLSQA